MSKNNMISEYKDLVSCAASDEYIIMMNDISKYPEVYKNKTLLLDLVLTPSRSGIRGWGHLKGETILFLKQQLKENGTLEAIEKGNILDFIATEAKNENYTFVNYYHPEIDSHYGDKERELISNMITSGVTYTLRTKNERERDKENYYQKCIKDNKFDDGFLFNYLKDHDRKDEILALYKRFMQKKLKEGNNPHHDKSYSSFAEEALKCGHKDLFLEIFRDMAKYTFPYDYEYDLRPKEFRQEDHYIDVDVIGCAFANRKEIMKNGIQNEVMEILNEYKKRPEIDFYIKSNLLAKKRKGIAQKFDKKFDTNVENIGITKIGKRLEHFLSGAKYGKNNGEDLRINKLNSFFDKGRE